MRKDSIQADYLVFFVFSLRVKDSVGWWEAN